MKSRKNPLHTRPLSLCSYFRFETLFHFYFEFRSSYLWFLRANFQIIANSDFFNQIPSIIVMSSSSPKQQPRLAPGWGGRSGSGTFQPPPVPNPKSDGRFSSLSSSSPRNSTTGRISARNSNSFSMLDDEDPPQPPSLSNGTTTTSPAPRRVWGSSSGKGRTLSDLAASKAPSTASTSSSSGKSNSHSSQISSSIVDDKPIIRYTRERLLSMRRPVDDESVIPSCLEHLVGLPVLVERCQEPVCFDDFDPDAIWALVKVSRNISNKQSNSNSTPLSSSGSHSQQHHHNSSNNNSGDSNTSNHHQSNTWRRGVALPPADRTGGKTTRSNRDVVDANELWDDPMTTSNDFDSKPAEDFSAFGGSIDDDPNNSSLPVLNTFDLGDMAEATRKFEEDMRRNGSSQENDSENHNNIGHRLKYSDDEAATGSKSPVRFAGKGVTIQSGGGDDVNVFEDFSPPAGTSDPAVIAATTSASTAIEGEEHVPTDQKVDIDASSKLMEIIGVGRDNEATSSNIVNEIEEPIVQEQTMNPSTTSLVSSVSTWGDADNISAFGSNPWRSVLEVPTSTEPKESSDSFSSKLMSAMNEQRQREAELLQKQREEELRKQEEHARMVRDQQENQRRAPQEARPNSEASQLELILMERIGNILEKHWGRAEVSTVLTDLHREDHRVVNLIQNVGVLRSLIARHPSRVNLAQDSTYGAEFAVLVYQQQQQQQPMAKAPSPAVVQIQINPKKPWFYRDPQNNIQGPFGGKEMQQWLQAGYFSGELPISQMHQGPFRPLIELFPDPKLAFQDPSLPTNNAEEIAVARAKELQAAEEEQLRLQQQEVEAKRRLEEEAVAKARKEAATALEAEKAAQAAKLEAERKAAAAQQRQTQVDQQSSAQLKMLLGMNETIAVDARSDPQPQSTAPPCYPKQQQYIAAKAPITAAPSAWGTPSAPQRTKKQMTLSQIQAEEARVAAKERQSTARGSTGSGSTGGSGGWANVAASGWSSGKGNNASDVNAIGGNATGRPGAANVAVSGRVPSATAPSATSTHALRLKQQEKVAAQKKAMAKNQAQIMKNNSTSNSNQNNVTEAFGENGKMSPIMEAWCRDQLIRLNGSDDLTLASFCMTLKDSNEIHQYLSAYLGNSSEVNKFATEFILRKGGGSSRETEWESTGTKKNRKKKVNSK